MNKEERERAEDDAARMALLFEFGRHRGNRGLSQRAVAKAMGTSQSAVSEIAQGITPDPRIAPLQRMARAIGGRLVITLEIGEDAEQSVEDRQIAVMVTLTRAVTELTDTIAKIQPLPPDATDR